MKLRNKKTGMIEYLVFSSYPVSGDIVLEYVNENSKSGYSEYCRYKTLAELNEDWEDYKPIEPLIKDEEIREIIRAWADVNDAGKLKYNDDENSLDDIYRNTITFNRGLGLEDGCSYTIPELCGEEEE